MSGIAEMSNLPEDVRKLQMHLMFTIQNAVTRISHRIWHYFLFSSVLIPKTPSLFSKSYIKFSRWSIRSCRTSDWRYASLFIWIYGNDCCGENIRKIVNEVRRQFAENMIMTGRSKPEYGKAVDILTKGAISNDYSINVAVLAPFNDCHPSYLRSPAAAFTFRSHASRTITGLFVAISMTSGEHGIMQKVYWDGN